MSDSTRFELAVEHSPAGVVMIGPDGRITLVNREAERMFGYDRTDLVGQPLEILLPDRFRSAHRAERAAYNGKPAHRGVAGRELVGRCRDGSEIPIEVGLNPIETADGPMVLASVVDVSARLRAEEALRAGERRLQTLFETVNLIVLMLDRSGAVEYVNPYFLRLTGYQADQVLGRNWIGDFLPSSQHEEMQRVFLELMDQDLHSHYRNAIVTRSGEERLIAWHNTVVRDEGGQATGTLSIGEDVTDHVRLEEQFRLAQRMEAVGRLAGGVAHDFNNLLTVILSYSELILTGLRPDDPLREDLGQIRDAGRRAADLTRQLLAFSRQQMVNPRVVNLNEVVRGVQRMLERLVGEDVRIELDLDPGLGNLRADPGMLEQVIVNLAVNARDAMPGGGTLTIATANLELDRPIDEGPASTPPGRYVTLRVSDTGHGMEDATRARIFEPFFTTKELGRGTGLGLSTVYGIVKQSTGFIWVTSAPGRGASFRIYLPRVDRAADPAPAITSLRATGGSETVLLVEDDPTVRKVAREALEQGGYRVLASADGVEALRLVEGETAPIHLLVTDLIMPRMGGAELARRLASLRPGLPILCVSGYADRPEQRDELLATGAAFLDKPVTPGRLLRKVRDVLDRAAG